MSLARIPIARRALALTIALLVWLATPRAMRAQSADSAEVVRVAQQLLTAISTKDAALARRIMLPGGSLIAVQDPAPAAGKARLSPDSSFYAMLSGAGPALLERMWQPGVQVHGSLAVVQAPYDFHVGGAFSHCGTDTFTLVKHEGAWRVASVAYTVQPKGCAPSPLGPPARP